MAATATSLPAAQTSGFQRPKGFKKLGSARKGIIKNLEAGNINLLNRDSAITKADLQDFTGAAGNVIVNPFTGQPVKQGKGLNVDRFQRNTLAQLPLEKAGDFQFTNLPEQISPEIIKDVRGTSAQLGQAAGNLLGGGGQAITEGQQQQLQAVGNLLGTQGQVAQAAQTGLGGREEALAELRNLRAQALSPTLDPEQRQFFQQRADERRAEVLSRFDEGGDIANQFSRQRASDLADLQARGVLDSTTAANVLGERDARLGALANQLLGDASELSRQEELAERGRIGQAAGQFGGLESFQATGAGQLAANLLGQQADIGQTIGQFGLQGQGIGADLSRLGLQGLQTGGQLALGAGQLGQAARGQEADIELAQLGTQLGASQQALANILGISEARLNKFLAEENLKLSQEALAKTPGALERLTTAAIGAAGAAA